MHLKTTADIDMLEKCAGIVLELKQNKDQRRPIVIEFCGTPKAGKTSCINSLNIFLKRNGFKTRILTERASVCPIPSKSDPSFNLWTMCSSLADFLNNFKSGDAKIDVIIADRGIFDSLCWFEWHLEKKFINESEHKVLVDFLTLPRWHRVVDLIYVFGCSPKTSLEREYASLLTRKEGSIMNTKTISSYSDAVNVAVSKYDHQFRQIFRINTDSKTQNDVSYEVTSKVLTTLQSILEEHIGYFVPNGDVVFPRGVFEFDKFPSHAPLHFDLRSAVESMDYVQPIPVGIVTNAERSKVLIVKKSDKAAGKDSPEREKLLVYAGGHIRDEDKEALSGDDILDVFKNALGRELNEELGISYCPGTAPFFVYTPEYGEKSKKHVAVCYVIEVDFDQVRFNLNPEELVQKKGKSRSGQVVDVEEFFKDYDGMESWSKLILNHVFNKSSPSQQYKLPL